MSRGRAMPRRRRWGADLPPARRALRRSARWRVGIAATLFGSAIVGGVLVLTGGGARPALSAEPLATTTTNATAAPATAVPSAADEAGAGFANPSPPPAPAASASGARSDAVLQRCADAPSTWTASGTVTNTAATRANYVIEASFLDAEGATVESGWVSVRPLDRGGIATWSVVRPATASGLRCVLHVVRTPSA